MKNYKDLITFVVPQLCTGGVEINFLNLSNKLIEEFSRIEILYQQEIDSGDYKSKFDKKALIESFISILELSKEEMIDMGNDNYNFVNNNNSIDVIKDNIEAIFEGISNYEK